MRVLVSDTSVLVDLERGNLLVRAFSLEGTFAVPDVLFEQELRPYGGEQLLEMGLRVEKLDGAGVELAQEYRRKQRALTVADSFALALSKKNDWILLSGDGALRSLASDEQVECHGVLWVLDRLESANIAPCRELHEGLKLISEHPKCRLPKKEIQIRLERYAALIQAEAQFQSPTEAKSAES
jgi:hypothetical protein